MKMDERKKERTIGRRKHKGKENRKIDRKKETKTKEERKQLLYYLRKRKN